MLLLTTKVRQVHAAATAPGPIPYLNAEGKGRYARKVALSAATVSMRLRYRTARTAIAPGGNVGHGRAPTVRNEPVVQSVVVDTIGKGP